MRRRRGETAQAAVEFSLVTIAMMFIMAGVLDFSRAVWYYNTVAEAVRAGARYAVVHGNDCGSAATYGLPSCTAAGPTADDATVATHVRNRAYGLEASAVTVTSSWPNGNNRAGSSVQVSATFNFTPFLSAFIAGGPTIPLEATSRMTIIY